MSQETKTLRKRESRKREKAQWCCDQWNASHPVGTLVQYRSLIGEQTKWDVVGKTRSEAWVVCGEAVVSIEGKAGGVALTHLTVL